MIIASLLYVILADGRFCRNAIVGETCTQYDSLKEKKLSGRKFLAEWSRKTLPLNEQKLLGCEEANQITRESRPGRGNSKGKGPKKPVS